MKLKFQKRSKLKLVSRIIPPQAEDIADILDIPQALPSEINVGLICRCQPKDFLL